MKTLILILLSATIIGCDEHPTTKNIKSGDVIEINYGSDRRIILATDSTFVFIDAKTGVILNQVKR